MTQHPLESPIAATSPQPGNWVPIGEFSLDHLYAPDLDVEGMTRLEALTAYYKGLGAQAVTISMNGHNSPEANSWNSANTNAPDGPVKGDYVYSVMALMPPDGKSR